MKYFINLLFLLFFKSSSLMAIYEKNAILNEVNNFLNSEKESTWLYIHGNKLFPQNSKSHLAPVDLLD